MSANYFSIDIGDQFTKMAHLKAGKQITLESLGYENTFDSYFTNLNEKSAQEQAKIIKTLHKQLRIGSTRAHVVIPDTKTYFQLLLMPNISEEELVKAIRLQADEFVPLPISEVYLDIEIIKKLPNGKLLIVFIASQKKIVDHIYKTLKYAEIEPVSLENELNSVGRFLTEFYKLVEEPTLILNFGFTGSSIYVANPTFPYFQITRISRIGFDVMMRDLKLNTTLSSEKALEVLSTIGLNSKGSINVYSSIYPVLNELFSEVEKTVRLTQERYNFSIKKIYLMNYDSNLNYMSDALQKRLSIQTLPFPISKVLTPNKITQAFSRNISSFIPVIATHIR